MILDTPDLWDAEALDAIITYRGSRKQVWDNTEIGGPWPNLMRNSLNVQVFSFRHPDFLEVSATHGSAQLSILTKLDAMVAPKLLPSLIGVGLYKRVGLYCPRGWRLHSAKAGLKRLFRGDQPA